VLRLTFLNTPLYMTLTMILYGSGGQLAARGPHVAHHSIFSGLRRHSGKIIKSEISSNLSQKILVLRLS